MNELRVTPCLTPHGRIVLAPSDDAVELESGLARRLAEAFARGASHGLLRLGPGEVAQVLSPVFSYWRELGARYVTALCTTPGVEKREHIGPEHVAEAIQYRSLDRAPRR